MKRQDQGEYQLNHSMLALCLAQIFAMMFNDYGRVI